MIISQILICKMEIKYKKAITMKKIKKMNILEKVKYLKIIMTL